MSKIIALWRTHFETAPKMLLKKLAIFAGVAAFALLFVYIFAEVPNRPTSGEYYAAQPAGLTSAIQENDLLSQKVVFPCEHVRSMWLFFDDSEASYAAMYLVSLYDENDELVCQDDFKIKEDASPVNILPLPLSNVKGKTYTLTIQLARTTMGSTASFYQNAAVAYEPNAELNGAALGGPLAIQINMGASDNTWAVVLILFAALLAVVLLLLGKNEVINTAGVIIAFGCFIAVLNPLGDVADEYAHFHRAETLSEGTLFGTATQMFEADTTLDEIMTMGNAQSNTFARFSDAALYEKRAGQDTQSIAAGTAGNYFFVGYLASALGLWIGKGLGISAMRCLYLSRMLNVLFYALLCAAAVAAVPKFKRTFSFIACLPMSLFLAASFNPDGITLGLILLCVAVFLRLTQQKDGTVTLWQTGLWLLLTLCMSLTRIAYAFLLLLIFLIPKKAYRRADARRWVALQFAAVLAIALTWTALSGLGGLRAIDGASASGQLAYLAENAASGIHVLLRPITEDLYTLYSGMFLLGWQSYNIGWIGFLLPVLLVHLMVCEQPLEKPVPHMRRVGTILVVLIYAVTYLGMYVSSNVVGAQAVLGVQGRYFLEMFALLPLFLCPFASNKKIGRYTGWGYSSLLFAVLTSVMIVHHYM